MQPTLTPQEIQRARELKQEGRTPQQIMGYLAGKRVNTPSTLSVIKKESEFAPQQEAPSLLSRIATDVPQDITSGIGNLGRDFQQRFGNMQETAQATLAGEQGVGQTALQLGGQIAGGFADTAFRTLQTAASLPLTQEAETAVGEAVGSAVTKVDNATGISNWYNTLDSKTQRNIEGALGFGELATIGLGKSITGQIMDKIKGAPKIEQLALPPKNMSYVANEATQGNIAPAVKVTNTVLSESERTKVVNDFTEAYRSSLVENRQSINNKLEDIAKSASRGETVVTRDSLLRNLAEEGYVPEIEGRLAKFDSAFNDVQARKSEIMDALDRVLETATNKVSIDELYEMSRKALSDNPQIVGGLARSQAELDRLFSSYRQKFGDELTARQVNQIRKESNELTRAFKDSDKFSADTASELGKVTREWLDNNVPDNTVRQANAEWARLNRLDETMQVLNNQQVDVGLLGRALGSYVTTVAGSTAGLAVGGPGGLVVAGLLAKIGGDGLADLIRRRIFDPETAAKVRQIMQSDRTLLQKLGETATNQANKNTLNDLAGFNIGEQLALPPARPDAPRTAVGSGAPIRVAPGGESAPQGQVIESARAGAVRRSDSEPVPTEIQKAIQKDSDAVEQAFAEIDADLTGDTRTSIGDNLVQNADGGYYRFNELPSWIPENLRDGSLMAKVIDNINNNRNPRSNATNEIELQEVVEQRIKQRAEQIKNTDTQGVFTPNTAFAVALMAGGTYYLMSEDGAFLPVVAGMAVATNPLARGAASQQIRNHLRMLAKQIKTLEDSGVSSGAKYSQLVKAYDAAIVEKQKIETPSFNQGATPNLADDIATPSLLEEAKKFDNGADFYNYSTVQIRDEMQKLGVRGKEQFENWYNNNVKAGTKSYAMSHRPTQTGATADNITQEVSDMGFPTDFYENPQFYAQMSDKASKESLAALMKVRGNPDATVTIYRASPKNEINEGDWITLSKEYAKRESMAENTPVHSFKVKAKDIQFAGDDINEFGYWPTQQ